MGVRCMHILRSRISSLHLQYMDTQVTYNMASIFRKCIVSRMHTYHVLQDQDMRMFQDAWESVILRPRHREFELPVIRLQTHYSLSV